MSCGLSAACLWTSWGKKPSYTHKEVRAFFTWGKASGVLNSLYQNCTQFIHDGFVVSTVVNPWLYPLSTEPIKTTTSYLKKGY
jgi:hypothetical protein